MFVFVAVACFIQAFMSTGCAYHELIACISHTSVHCLMYVLAEWQTQWKVCDSCLPGLVVETNVGRKTDSLGNVRVSFITGSTGRTLKTDMHTIEAFNMTRKPKPKLEAIYRSTPIGQVMASANLERRHGFRFWKSLTWSTFLQGVDICQTSVNSVACVLSSDAVRHFSASKRHQYYRWTVVWVESSAKDPDIWPVPTPSGLVLLHRACHCPIDWQVPDPPPSLATNWVWYKPDDVGYQAICPVTEIHIQ